MPKSDKSLLHHILDECNFIHSILENGITEDDFLTDEVLKRAFVRSIEIIGEAAKNLSAELKETKTGMDWRNISGMRNRLIHEYFGINYLIVWDVIKNKIPELRETVIDILEKGKNNL